MRLFDCLQETLSNTQLEMLNKGLPILLCWKEQFEDGYVIRQIKIFPPTKGDKHD